VATLSDRRKILLIVLSVLIFCPLLVCMFLPRLIGSQNGSQIESNLKLKISTYDFYSRDPIGGVEVTVAMASGNNLIFRISEVSDDNGTVIAEISSPQGVALPLSFTSLDLSGRWALMKVVGNETYRVADRRWKASDRQSFLLNVSRYCFSGIGPSVQADQDGSILDVGLYLTPGWLIGVYDPIPDVGVFDRHVTVKIVDANFVEFEDMNSAIVPIGKPLILKGTVSYLSGLVASLNWNFELNVDLEDREFIDLTPPLIRALSATQVREIRRILNMLSLYGFELGEQYEKLANIKDLYDQAASDIELQNYGAAFANLQRAAALYFDVYSFTIQTYSGSVFRMVTFGLIIILFSLIFSRLIAENKREVILLFLASLAITSALFGSTQPYLRLLVSDPSVLFQSITLAPLVNLVLVVPVVVAILLVGLSRIRDLLWETLEVSIRNLKRRRLRTSLTLFTIVVVSASAMSLLTFGTERPSLSFPLRNVKPAVDYGLVIYKHEVRRAINPSRERPPQLEYYLPIQQQEIEWFSSQVWVEDFDIYGIKRIRLMRADGFMLGNLSTFNLVIINPTFTEKYQNVSRNLKVNWLAPQDSSMILVGSTVAEKYDLAEGSEIILDDRRFIVKDIFDEKTVVEKLKDIDGSFFLFQLSDPGTGKIEQESFIFGSLYDFDFSDFAAYRVSIRLKEDYGGKLAEVAEDILKLGYSFYETGEYRVVDTYIIHVVSSGSVSVVFSDFPVTVVIGQWQNHIVPLIFAGMILFSSTLGAVSERKSEIKTVYVVGASPLRIRMAFVIEGLTLGIIGGIFGYVLGYFFAEFSQLALPTLVRQNITSESPFVIAILMSVTASVLGCLVPSRAAVNLVVPSGRLRNRLSDLAAMEGNEALLDMPMKTERLEASGFRHFLKEWAEKKQSSRSTVGMNVEQISFTEALDEKTQCKVILSYSSDITEQSSYFQLFLSLEEGLLRVALRPVDAWTKRECSWSSKHKHNMENLVSTLRDEIFEFIDWERRAIS